MPTITKRNPANKRDTRSRKINKNTRTSKRKSEAKSPAIDRPRPSATTTTTTTTTGPICFWKPHEVPYGIFSQWYASTFTAPNPDGTTTTFNTAEQYMMYQKAILFNDADIAAEILSTSDARTQKALGRAVSGFDEATWCARRFHIVSEGTYWKFKNDPTVLLESGERELVEAAPRDRVWGVGFGAVRAPAERKRWGLNLLGKALMETRTRIKNERATAEEEKEKEGEA